jgi:hypothetical protein
MIRFLADENFNGIVLRGLLRRIPTLDVLRAQDVGLTGASDAEVLAFAAAENRIVLTHDVRTFSRFAYQRVAERQPMPGVFEVGQELPVSVAIDELVLLAECSIDGEWEGQVRYLPL